MKRSYTTGLIAYVVAEKLADGHLRLGYSVIIDAVNGAYKARQMWRDHAAQQQAQLIIIECAYSNKNLHKKRTENRVRNLPGFDALMWNEVMNYEKDYTKWNEPHLALDSSNAPSKNLSTALSYIEKQ